MNSIQLFPMGGRHHLLPLTMCFINMLELDLKLGLSPGHSNMGCRFPKWWLTPFTTTTDPGIDGFRLLVNCINDVLRRKFNSGKKDMEMNNSKLKF